jgi:cytidine deaminase
MTAGDVDWPVLRAAAVEAMRRAYAPYSHFPVGVAVACVDGNGDPLAPCGRCRQLLWEHGGPDCQVELTGRVWRMQELLPEAFGPDNLEPAERHPSRGS